MEQVNSLVAKLHHEFQTNRDLHTLGFDCWCRPLVLSGMRHGQFGWELFDSLTVVHR